MKTLRGGGPTLKLLYHEKSPYWPTLKTWLTQKSCPKPRNIFSNQLIWQKSDFVTAILSQNQEICTKSRDTVQKPVIWPKPRNFVPKPKDCCQTQRFVRNLEIMSQIWIFLVPKSREFVRNSGICTNPRDSVPNSQKINPELSFLILKLDPNPSDFAPIP